MSTPNRPIVSRPDRQPAGNTPVEIPTWVGQSTQAQEVLRRTGVATALGGPVWITGDQGTGRRHLARILGLSLCGGPHRFAVHDCSQLSLADLQRLLSGTDGGTLCLHGIEHLSHESQVHLAGCQPAGTHGSAPNSNDAQRAQLDLELVCTSTVSASLGGPGGGVCQELRNALERNHIHIPPLRERSGDIPLLVGHLLARTALRLGMSVPEVTPGTMTALVSHSWPGNVAELEAAVRYALLASHGAPIGTEHLPDTVAQPVGREPEFDDVVHLLDSGTHQLKHYDLLEREIFDRARIFVGGSITQAARALGVGRATLYRRYQVRGNRNAA